MRVRLRNPLTFPHPKLTLLRLTIGGVGSAGGESVFARTDDVLTTSCCDECAVTIVRRGGMSALRQSTISCRENEKMTLESPEL
jgi:hypothetical protein